MGRGYIPNLITPSAEEARILGSAGGKKSGEARRKKIMLRDCLSELLEMQNKSVLDDAGIPVTNAVAMSIKAVEAANNGDWKAWELVRDTAGQKPVERMVIADVDAETLADVERLVEGIDEE